MKQRDQRGLVATELAILLPILFLIALLAVYAVMLLTEDRSWLAEKRTVAPAPETVGQPRSGRGSQQPTVSAKLSSR